MKTFLFILPFIFILLPYFLQYYLYKLHFNKHEHKWRAMHFSIAWTFAFYLAASILMVIKLYEVNTTGYLIISMVLVIIIILIVQYRKTEEVILTKALKLVIRIYYLLGIVAYTTFLVISIVKIVKFVWPMFF